MAHYSVRVTDLDVSTAFYTEALGLLVGPRPPFGFPGAWLYLARDEEKAEQGSVHLIGPGDASALDVYLGRRNEYGAGPTDALDHIAFFADDWPACRERLETRGVDFTERVVPGLAVLQIFLVDPNGVTIELNFPQVAA